MQAAAQNGSPQAQLAAQQGIAAIEGQKQQNNMLMAATSNSASPGAEGEKLSQLNLLQRINPELYKQEQAKYIPGVGMASIPVSEDDRKVLTTYDDLGKKIQAARDFADNKATILAQVPKSKQAAMAQSLADGIQQQMSVLAANKRIPPEMMKQFQDAAGDPGSFLFSEEAKQKLADLADRVDTSRKTEQSHLGVRPFKKSPIDQTAVAWARGPGAGTPEASAILAKNGQR